MSDRGMWNMNIELFSYEKAFKKCSGHRDEWHPECNEDYPDHMVPVSGFGKDSSSKDGLHHRCLKCDRMRVADEQRHPITNEHKRNWKHRIAKQLGGTQGMPGWKENLNEAERRWSVDMKNHLLNTAPAEEVIAFIQSRKSEFGQSKPMTKRTITKVEGEKVDEGWVYVARNPDVPHILKIGKTFPDGIASIMSDARRFGRAELVAKYYFKEAYKAEQSIHKRLERHNLRVLGYKDCGKELFQCDEMVAIFAILAEGPVLDDTEDAA